METLRLISDARILPTLRLARAEDAPSIFAALCSGSINAALISIHSDNAPAILRQGSRLFPDLLLGIDGIASVREADDAIESGARIVSTNGFSAEIAALCREKDAFYLPFCMTPSELLAHQMQGGKAAGLFAPEACGSLALTRALADAFPRLPLVAGSIPLDRIADYLAIGSVVACTCPDIASGTLDEIIEKCRRASAGVTQQNN